MAEVEFSVKENGIFRGEEENGGQKLNLEALQDLTINDFGSKFLNEIDGTIQISYKERVFPERQLLPAGALQG